MAEIVNLGRVRKARRNAADAAEADANRIRHGRTKAERMAAGAEAERRRQMLDGARLDGGSDRDGEAGE